MKNAIVAAIIKMSHMVLLLQELTAICTSLRHESGLDPFRTSLEVLRSVPNTFASLGLMAVKKLSTEKGLSSVLEEAILRGPVVVRTER
jgi:hypothetical protein